MRAVQARMESCLAAALPPAKVAPARLHEAMRYASLDGGKRVRPLLVFAAGEVSQSAPERLEIAAAAVELIHTYSLVHDDLPCMDDDTLRRGKATTHIEFDQATALLVGDSLQSLAFQILSERPVAESAQTQLEMIALLARAIGSRGMAGGQAIDLASIDKTLSVPELEFMHIHKTGALIRAAVMLGAHCCRALTQDELKALDSYAKWVGLAFQVVDDILDARETTATLGKTAGKDAQANKPTYVSIMGPLGARTLAQELHEKALAALRLFDAKANRLREIAEFILNRSN
jgi:farnesyl diphosphate synthase